MYMFMYTWVCIDTDMFKNTYLTVVWDTYQNIGYEEEIWDRIIKG